MKKSLPLISKVGSKDDMSVACVFDENRLQDAIPQLIGWQRSNVKEQIDAVNTRILSLYEKKEIIENKQIKEQKDKIDFDYFLKDITRSFKTKEALISKYDKFSRELSSENFVPYSDDIGLGNQSTEELVDKIIDQQPIPNTGEE